MAEPVRTPLRRYSCTLTKDDYEALLKRFDEPPLPMSLVLAAAVLVGLGWGAMDPGWYGELALLPIIALAAAALYGLAHVWRRIRRARRLARWRPPAAPIEVEIFADQLAAREDGRTRLYAWDDILSVSFDKGRVYLAKSRDDILILPLSAFENRQAMHDFVLMCEDLMREPGDEAPASTDAPGVALAPSASRPMAALPLAAAGGRQGVDVTLTGDDARQVEAALRPAGANAPVRLSTAALTLGMAGAAIFGGPVWLVATGSPETRLFAGALAGLAGAIVLTFLGARRIESARAAQWPADDPRRMTRRIEIDEAGFVSRGAEFETRIAWAGVESIRETEQHILFITRWKEIYAVPMRCFPDAEAGHAFANEARALKTAS
ncbi:MAG: YcxB family protein [Beijerinckiaceae bacterium]